MQFTVHLVALLTLAVGLVPTTAAPIELGLAGVDITERGLGIGSLYDTRDDPVKRGTGIRKYLVFTRCT
jgi:hypothetical protein